jgi:GNAT superfamily N-acetyltransferase
MIPLTLSEICLRLEKAQAAQNAGYARSMARHDPASGAQVLELPGALGIFLGEGHFLNQGLAMGLDAGLSETDLSRLEMLLGRGGCPIVVELTPGADPGLSRQLSRHGYEIVQFQQVWLKELSPMDLAVSISGVTIRPAAKSELLLFSRLVMAGFSEQDELPGDDVPLPLPPLEVEGTTPWLAWAGEEPAAGGTLGILGEVAALSGTAVLPRFRGNGLQRAMIAARLEYARRAGAVVACSATLPWSASGANLERMGFRIAYPKLELRKE